ncbi:glutathione S-transferase kappa 1-like isoform X2 [Panulirus ornatus]|uniref:glutathione S-transferase kappa 1-like isoform X2 n=1 Tax=Panulirus ornatus TaxID=150431 RepID=UPI003A8ACD79
MERLANRLLSTGPVGGKKKIELYYDIISPYTWFAFEVLMRYRKHWNVDVQLKPMLLGGVAKASGNKAPMLVPNKALYMTKDLTRNAAYFNVPLKLVTNAFDLILVKGSLIPSRFITSVDLLYPAHLEAVSRALWMEVWNKDQDFTTPEVLAQAGRTAGLMETQIAQIQAHMKQQVTKDRLKAYTDEAINHGDD